MKRLWFILLAICCFAHAQSSVNLVKNPSFEELDGNGWPKFWSHRPATFKSATDNMFEGERSVMYFNKTKGQYQFVTQRVPVEPGKTYEFAIYAKQVNLPEAKNTRAPAPDLFMEFWDNGNYLGGEYTTSKQSLNTDWMKLVGRTTIPQGASRVSVGFRAIPNGTNVTEIWFDNCSVREVESTFIDRFSTTGNYRDTSDGGMVTIYQGVNRAMKFLPKEDWKAIRMNIIDSAGKNILTLSPDTFHDDFVTFTFDSGKLSTGKYTLRGTFTNPKTGSVNVSNATFTKVDKLPQYKTMIDSHRRMIVDGKPFFPLGMYFSDVTKENLQPYLGTKFNCIMPYNSPKDAEIYDYLHQNNIRMFFSIKDNVSARKPLDPQATVIRQAKGIASLDKWKHHPCIIAWYINDELPPDFVDDAIQYQRKCEEHDPTRPTWSVLNGAFREFTVASDIIGNDSYPIPNRLPSAMFNSTRKLNDVVMGSKMILSVPQAFCWGRYWVKYGYDKEKCANCRRPSYEEIDAMSWMCIAGGANGLIYYSYFDMMLRDKATDILPRIPFDEHFGECKQIAERIMAHEKVLLSIEKPIDFTVTENAGNEVAFRPYALDGVTWLLVVNTSEKAARTIKLEMARPVTLNGVTLSQPDVSVDGKAVTATFKPLESAFIKLK